MDGSAFDRLSRRVASLGSRRQAIKAIAGAMVATVAGTRATAEAQQACQPHYNACATDSECCIGAVCQWGLCMPGCRIDGAFVNAWTPQPGNVCAGCRPESSTTGWSPANEGIGCWSGSTNLCGGPSSCRAGICQPSGGITCQPLTVCHAAGECDPGTGLCTNPPAPAGKVCGGGEMCVGGFHTSPMTCDGNGFCTSGPTAPCAPYTCDGPRCRTDCTADSQCAPGAVCVANACVFPAVNGQACAGDRGCQSDHCVEGICCDTACNGSCDVCATGTCDTLAYCFIADNCIPAGTISSPGCRYCDPRQNKFDWTPRPDGDYCLHFPLACFDGQERHSTCRDNGLSCDFTYIPCDPYGCSSDGVNCATSCTNDNQCAAGAVCIGNACIVPVANGQACTADRGCQSGFCVEDVCCDSACPANCDTCATGTCSPIICDDDRWCTASSCDQSSGTCQHLTNDDACLISNTCYEDGARHPFSSSFMSAYCLVCDPSTDKGEWTRLDPFPTGGTPKLTLEFNDFCQYTVYAEGFDACTLYDLRIQHETAEGVSIPPGGQIEILTDENGASVMASGNILSGPQGWRSLAWIGNVESEPVPAPENCWD